jgi:AraC-like DNA-binding protein
MTTSSLKHHLLVQADDTTHRLEENVLYRETFAPIDDPCPPATFVLAIGIEGRSNWRLDTHECTLGPRQLIAFMAHPGVLVRRHESGEARFLLWHFNTEKMRLVREALGQPDTALASTCQSDRRPLAGPFNLNAGQQALVLSLRCAPSTPLRNLWYGAKLLELFAILQPPTAPGPSAPGYLHPAVQRTLATIHANFVSPPGLGEIAAKAGVGTTHLSRLFAKETGMTLSAYLRQLRMEHASRLLLTGECNVTEAAFAVGYASLGQFSYAFRQTYGHPPGHHRQSKAALGALPVPERISG